MLISSSTYGVFGHGEEVPWLTMHSVGNKPRDHRVGENIEAQFFLENPPKPTINFEPYYTGWLHEINKPAGEEPPPNSARDVYFATLLKHIGCTATAHEESVVFGPDELGMRAVAERTGAAPSRARQLFFAEPNNYVHGGVRLNLAGREPSGRVGEHRLEGELSRAEQRPVRPQRAGDHAQQLARRSERPPVEHLVELVGDERMNPLEHASEHDERRVEDVVERGQPDAEPPSDMGNALEGLRLSRLGCGDELVDRLAPARRAAAGAQKHGALADLRLPAAEGAAAAA